LLNPSKILILRLSSIGDVILTTPLVRAVRARFPRAEISFLVKQEFADLLRHNPRIDRLITFDKATGFRGWRQIGRNLRQERFDWVIDLHRNARTRYLKAGLRAGTITTYRKQLLLRTLLVRTGINLLAGAPPILNRYFEAVETAGVRYDGQGTEVFPGPGAAHAVSALLASEGRDASAALAVLCPGASWANKQWLPERFAAVADDLAARGLFVVLLGGGRDEPLCRTVAGMMRGRAAVLAGRLGLGEAAALLGASAIAVTNDSGLMHLAQSQKTPVVAIFGPTTAELGYFPLPERAVVVQQPLACRPCTHNGRDRCPKGHFRCMREISADAVIGAARSLLGA
jgi:heptosyltransferase-2